jgi:uncharacterized secreted protein with C-terminal beta-propeller domain
LNPSLCSTIGTILLSHLSISSHVHSSCNYEHESSQIIGGKGTPRRKQVKKSSASAAGDDRKLQAALHKMNVQPVTGVEEVNMFKEDGNVLHFNAPKGELVWLFYD